MTVIAPNRQESLQTKTKRPTNRMAEWMEGVSDAVNGINPDGTPSLDHTALTNIGTNSHAQIDAQLGSNAANIAINAANIATNTADIASIGVSTDAELLHFWFD